MLQVTNGKFQYRDQTMTTDTGDTGQLDTVGDVAQIDISDLRNVVVYLNQIVDNGTITIILDYTVDGVNWISAVATKVETDFAVGNGEAEYTYSFSDANGMPIAAKIVRARCTVATGTGGYSLGAAGYQLQNYR